MINIKKKGTRSNPKINIALEKCSAEILEWWIRGNAWVTYCESFKTSLKGKFVQKRTLNDLKERRINQVIYRKSEERKLGSNTEIKITTIKNSFCQQERYQWSRKFD